jgi:hypothetical protein
MVNVNDSIRYKNVIARKYRFHYSSMEEVTTEFINDIVKLGATIKGPLFYSINNVPMDEVLNAEFFMPIEEDYIEVMEDMNFHSYFSIEDMIAYCVYTNFEQNTEIAYSILLSYIEQNHLQQVTPIFHILSGDKSLQYIFIKIGVISNVEEVQN